MSTDSTMSAGTLPMQITERLSPTRYNQNIMQGELDRETAAVSRAEGVAKYGGGVLSVLFVGTSVLGAMGLTGSSLALAELAVTPITLAAAGFSISLPVFALVALATLVTLVVLFTLSVLIKGGHKNELERLREQLDRPEEELTPILNCLTSPRAVEYLEEVVNHVRIDREGNRQQILGDVSRSHEIARGALIDRGIVVGADGNRSVTGGDAVRMLIATLEEIRDRGEGIGEEERVRIEEELNILRIHPLREASVTDEGTS